MHAILCGGPLGTSKQVEDDCAGHDGNTGAWFIFAEDRKPNAGLLEPPHDAIGRSQAKSRATREDNSVDALDGVVWL